MSLYFRAHYCKGEEVILERYVDKYQEGPDEFFQLLEAPKIRSNGKVHQSLQGCDNIKVYRQTHDGRLADSSRMRKNGIPDAEFHRECVDGSWTAFRRVKR